MNMLSMKGVRHFYIFASSKYSLSTIIFSTLHFDEIFMLCNGLNFYSMSKIAPKICGNVVGDFLFQLTVLAKLILSRRS